MFYFIGIIIFIVDLAGLRESECVKFCPMGLIKIFDYEFIIVCWNKQLVMGSYFIELERFYQFLFGIILNIFKICLQIFIHFFIERAYQIYYILFFYAPHLAFFQIIN